MATVDNLSIEISATADKASKSIDKLVGQIDTLSKSLGIIKGSGLQGLANGVQRLGTAMQLMNTVKTTDFTRLAKNITRLGEIPVSNLYSAASSLSILTTALNGLGAVSSNAERVGVLANSISKLGGKQTEKAVVNIPRLATALNEMLSSLSRAPQVSNNTVRLAEALATLASHGKSVQTATNAMTNQLTKYNNVAAKSKTITQGFASVVATLRGVYQKLKQAITAVYSSIGDTSDYIEAFNFYEVAFEKIASQWSHEYEKYGYDNAEAYSQSFTDRMGDTLGKLSGITFDSESMRLVATEIKNLGLNIQEVTQYAAQLASVTNSVGLTGEASLIASESFTKLAGDISSLFNVDYSTASQNLQSGLIGQSRALYKYGIDITNATLQTYAYNEGLTKTVSSMTQAEKMQLRMLAILDQSRVSWGNLADTINQPANAMRVLKNQVSELSIMFGQLFVPMLSKVIPVITGIVIALKRLISAIAGFFGIKINPGEMSQAFNDMEMDTEGAAAGFDNVTASAKKAKAGLRGFDELKTINLPSASGGAGGVGGVGSSFDLTEQIKKAAQEYQEAWQQAYDNMMDMAGQWAEKFEKIIQPVKDFFKHLSTGEWATAGEDFSKIISGIFITLAEAIDGVNWQYIGTAIGEFISGINWTEILQSIGKLIWESLQAGIEFFAGMFNAAPIETTISLALAALLWTPLGRSIGEKIIKGIILDKADITKIFTEGGFFNNIGLVIENLFSGLSLKDSMTAVFGKTATQLTGIGLIVGGLGISVAGFVDMWQGGWSLAGEIVKDLGIALLAVGAVMLGVVSGPVALIGAVIAAALSSVVVLFHDNWDAIKEFMSNWWNGFLDGLSANVDIAINFFKDGFSNILDFLIAFGNNFREIFSGIIDFFTGVFAGDWEKAWEGLKEIFGGVFKAIGNIGVAALNGLINGVEKMINWVGEGLGKLNFTAPDWVPLIGGKEFKIDLKTVTLKRIDYFYDGGFPQTADLFYANENGIPELVGTVGGRTAVASGTEITGISDAVYATGQAEARLLTTAVSLLEIIADKEFGISNDVLFRSVQNSAKNYTRRTGKLAFNY